VLVAIGAGSDGFRQILGVAEGEKEDLEGWRGFLCHLKDRGLKGVRLIISDACRGLVEAAAEVFPRTDWQRCVVHYADVRIMPTRCVALLRQAGNGLWMSA
jgi:putative transposase